MTIDPRGPWSSCNRHGAGWLMDFNRTLFFQILIIGITYGSMIALIALGYTLVYGIIELINFAHGEVFMMGAYFTMQVVFWLGVTAESPSPVVVGVLIL